MLSMSDINHIKDLASAGYSVSEIVKETGHDHKTINKYLEKEDFSIEPPVQIPRASIVDPYKDLIAQWLEEDRKHWKKQRHTAYRVYCRLRDEHNYKGSYDTIQKYMKKVRRRYKAKASQELIWEPGCAEVDFGECDVYEDNVCFRRKYLVVSFPYSNDAYVQFFRGETAECVCQGLKDIFEYIGAVPVMLVFDNATGVGHRVHNKVTETELFSKFRAHYGFRLRFCNPDAGYEKGNVENKVGTVRRNLFVPAPRYHDMVEFNKPLLDEHLKKAAEIHYKKLEKIAELFKEDLKHCRPLPGKSFNVCSYQYFKADGYGKVCLDGKHFYSTRPELHNQEVLVGIRAHYIDILDEGGSVLVRHRREYGDNRTDTSDYSTSLEVLAQNAGAWMNSGVRRDLPDPLREYMDSLEKVQLKHQIRLLRDLNHEYGYKPAIEAMAMALKNGSLNSSDATILAQRITGYGINTPPELGPSLSVYDDAFLFRGTEVAVS